MSKRKSHRRIEVSDTWLQQVRDWRIEQEMTLEEFGQAIGEAEAELTESQEAQPYVISSVTRMLAGRVSAEMARATAALTGIPLIEDSDAVIELQMWKEVGSRLWGLDKRLVLELLQDLNELADHLARIQQRIKERKQD